MRSGLLLVPYNIIPLVMKNADLNVSPPYRLITHLATLVISTIELWYIDVYKR
jgi:hypothetical protein